MLPFNASQTVLRQNTDVGKTESDPESDTVECVRSRGCAPRKGLRGEGDGALPNQEDDCMRNLPTVRGLVLGLAPPVQ